jgi:adenylate cyclase
MSVFSDQLISETCKAARSLWTSRDGQVVPDTNSVKLGNDRIEMEAVMLYADLADSTELAIKSQQIASEVFKSYLSGVTRIIKLNGGEVRSFDGDRVMGVFIGDRKNTDAAITGLQINWFFKYALETEFRKFYAQESLSNIVFNHTVGIDRSPIYVSRAGVRNDNDLIWVGRAPNIAAKLRSIRHEAYNTLITESVYSALLDSAKLYRMNGNDMWTELSWPGGAGYGVLKVYGSNWWWKPGA